MLLILLELLRRLLRRPRWRLAPPLRPKHARQRLRARRMRWLCRRGRR